MRVSCVALMLGTAITAVAQDRKPVKREHHQPTEIILPDAVSAADSIAQAQADSLWQAQTDSILEPLKPPSPYDTWEERTTVFSPDPTRAVWLSALFPGLGQIYNRRYWKLPIVVGAYMGLGYATSWNNSMLSDYTKAYRDIMDNDPGTNSYMNFFPPTTTEESLDKTWLTNLLQSRKNYFRRNRDLCIICMVAVYFVAMIDAYVDASLSHFDISPNLSMDLVPQLMIDSRGQKPGIGLSWALNF